MWFSRCTPLVTGALLAASLGAGGCVGSAITTGQDMAVGHDVDGSLRSDMAVNLQVEFELKVQPLLLGDCGACHAQAGGSYPGFLSPQPVSVYNTFINFPGLVGYTPQTSRILTKGPHANPAGYTAQGGYTPSAELQAHATVIADWITLFNERGGRTASADMGATTTKRITPFLPEHGVDRTVDLGELDAQYSGMTVSFTPVFSPAPPAAPSFITLKNLRLNASTAMGVHIKSPVFARYKAAEPQVAVDINYDYLGKDVTAFMGTSTEFDPSLVIFGYSDGELIGLSFETIERQMGAPDLGSMVGQCKNVAGFAAFKPQLTGTAGITCTNCHNAGVGGFSTSGFADAANDATSCAGTLLNAVVADPAQSPIYLEVTDPARSHTGGKLQPAQATAFLDQLTTWLNGEK